MLVALAALTLAAWLWLLAAHGGFWRARTRLPALAAAPPRWPEVVAVVPARDEADVAPAAVVSLLAQDYPGPLRVVLVDDESTDGTADVVRAAAARAGGADRLLVASTPARPPGWAGKPWAMRCGIEAAERACADAELWWLTDADIAHPRGELRQLVGLLEQRRLDLVSLMVRLDARTPWERLLIPAFVWFFQLLYPFAHVADPRRRIAAAAGGCMLVRRAALARAGGIAAVRDAIIDDCALARIVKRRGAIWLGHADGARSLRGYGGLRGVWRMVARTAYTQLGHAPAMLALTVLGLGLLFLAPPLLVLGAPLHGNALVAGAGALAWLLMAVLFAPTLAQYGRAPALGLLLPVAAALYAAMTVDSARRWRAGRGGEWKGRMRAGRAAGGEGAPGETAAAARR